MVDPTSAVGAASRLVPDLIKRWRVARTGRWVLQKALRTTIEETWLRVDPPPEEEFLDAAVEEMRQRLTRGPRGSSVEISELIDGELTAGGHEVLERLAASVDHEEFRRWLPVEVRRRLGPKGTVAEILGRDPVTRIADAAERDVDNRAEISPRALRCELRSWLNWRMDEARAALRSGISPEGIDPFDISRPVRVRPRAGGSAEGRSGSSATGGDGVDAGRNAGHSRRDDSGPVAWDLYIAGHLEVVVLADPGMGKSWLVHTETHRHLRRALAALDRGEPLASAVIPVGLRCDELVSGAGDTLGEAAADAMSRTVDLHPATRRWIADRIDAGGAVLFLDALDELDADTTRRRLGILLARWHRKSPGGRCVLTSRIAGYTGPPDPSIHPEEVELLGLEPAEVREFVDGWPLSTEARVQLLRRLDQPSTVELARTPLLLALLCDVAHWQRDTPLPETRAELYELIAFRFLRRTRRGIGQGRSAIDVEIAQILDALGPVSLGLADRVSGWSDLMSWRDWVSTLEAVPRDRWPSDLRDESGGRILDTLAQETGVLVPIGRDGEGHLVSYRFLHRTFAEYLAARHLARLSEPEWTEAVARHLEPGDDWAEIVPMLGALLAEPRRLLDLLLAQQDDPFHHSMVMTARVLGELKEQDATGLSEYVDALVERSLALLDTRAQDDGIEILRALRRWLALASVPLLERLVNRLMRGPIPRWWEDPPEILAGAVRTPVVRDALLAAVEELRGSDRWSYIGPPLLTALADAVEEPEVQQVMFAALTDNPYVSEAAQQVLADAASLPPIQDGLLSALRDPDLDSPWWEVVVQVVASALSVPELRAGLVEMWDSLDPERWAADDPRRADDDVVRDALVRTGAFQSALASRASLQPVWGLLSERMDDESVVHACRESVSVARVRQALLDRLGHANPYIRIHAAQALVAASPEDVRVELLRRLPRHGLDGWPKEGEIWFSLVRALAGGGLPVEARDELVTRLDDPERMIRVAIVHALAPEVAMPSVRRALLARLNVCEQDVPEDVSRSLRIVRRPTERMALVRVLGGAVHDREVRQRLLARLEDPEWQVAVAAAEALAPVASTHGEVQEALVDRLEVMPNRSLREVPPMPSWVDVILPNLEPDLRNEFERNVRNREGDVKGAVLRALADPGIDADVHRALADRFDEIMHDRWLGWGWWLEAAMVVPEVRRMMLDRMEAEPRYAEPRALFVQALCGQPDAFRGLLERLNDGRVRLDAEVYSRLRTHAVAALRRLPDGERDDVRRVLAGLTRRAADVPLPSGGG